MASIRQFLVKEWQPFFWRRNLSEFSNFLTGSHVASAMGLSHVTKRAVFRIEIEYAKRFICPMPLGVTQPWPKTNTAIAKKPEEMFRVVYGRVY
jgi:hypothetical protein